MKNGLEDYYVIRGNKKMRFGYTTGSCAAAACKGAAEILLGGVMQKAVTLMTPKGILLTLELKDIRIEGNQVTCAIQKDAGDDPDRTDSIKALLCGYGYFSCKNCSSHTQLLL